MSGESWTADLFLGVLGDLLRKWD